MLPDTITLDEIKEKTPQDLVSFAEEVGVDNASALRKQDLLFAILKELAEEEVEIIGSGVLEILPDGFGFLRSPDANYLAGPDDIYCSPQQIRKFTLKTGDLLYTGCPTGCGPVNIDDHLVGYLEDRKVLDFHCK